MIRTILRLAMLGALGVGTAQPALADAPLHQASDPKNRVLDNNGHALYIVDLRDDALDRVAGVLQPGERERFEARHSDRAVKLITQLERRHGARSIGMTSWTGLSFSAYLTRDQVKQLLKDPDVTSVSEAVTWSLSATPQPPWNNRTVTLPSGQQETYSWGRVAVGGVSANPEASPLVYVIDAGVGQHSDLNVIDRLAAPNVSPVGCYPHATHVAGMIGGSFQNGGGVPPLGGSAGVVAGVRIVSVSVFAGNWQSGPARCGYSAFNSTNIRDAVDRVAQDKAWRSPNRAVVVNISANSSDGGFASGGTVFNAVNALRNAGGFIVQSAGNANSDACSYAYAGPNLAAVNDDGIMVVGGIDANGARNTAGYANLPLAGNAGASNLGPCVDIWAPSSAIWSSWGPLVGLNASDSSTWQRDDTWYGNYGSIGGTSMAAPFVTGIAAAILQKDPLLSPGQVEAAVRAAAYSRGETYGNCTGWPPVPCQVNIAANPVASKLDDLIEHYYQNILGRASDVGGKNFWLDEIERMRALAADPREMYRVLGKQLFFSAEYTGRGRSDTDFVGDLYRTFYRRQPDIGGQNYWLSQMAQGMNRDAVLVSFIKSQEFTTTMTAELGASTQRAETGLVLDIYRGLFARLPDSGGFGYWRGRLRSAQCNGTIGTEANFQVNWAFDSSQEYASRGRTDSQYVADLYDLFFNREVDTGGFNFWTWQAHPSQMGRVGVRNQFLASGEWNARLQAIAAQGCMP